MTENFGLTGGHNCEFVTTGLALEVQGLYTGYREIQACSYPDCRETRCVRRARTMPDNDYAAGKLKPYSSCSCHLCSKIRGTWIR